MNYTANGLTLTFDTEYRALASVRYEGRELLAENQKPLFALRMRAEDGSAVVLSARDESCTVRTEETDGGVSIFYAFPSLTVKVTLRTKTGLSGKQQFVWGIGLTENETGCAVEYFDFPSVTYRGALRENGGDAAVLWPYNEGALIEDSRCKRDLTDPEYPSQGWYPMFPYMVFSQFTVYLFGNHGIYMGNHDAQYAPKAVDFANTDDTTVFRTLHFMGGTYNECVGTDYEIVWQVFDGDWYDGAALYRDVFEKELQPDLKPVSERPALPDWYRNGMPLVLTYPVRGIHDMDKMDPNRLFPYENVMPYVKEFSDRTASQIMVLLMHWEGTAPWAPPYVWPPYGGEDMFLRFRDRLHKENALLGVYCSGLGYTEQSNLIASYNCEKQIAERGLNRGMCLAPDQSLPHSRICTGQRSGYDLCPASPLGREVLDEALAPLLSSGIDYSQVMDQNHGGTMYFCYSKEHGHPPVPGKWMTKASAELLGGWKKACPDTLLGCESAAAEPYLGTLSLSDNRYELCYNVGKPVPLYAYLFHPYLHNFMGNQVSCPFDLYNTEGVNCRIAYSFLAGDLITLVLNDEGDIMGRWGMRDFSRKPDREPIIDFCGALHVWHNVYPDLFRDARMTKPADYTCAEKPLPLENGRENVMDKTVYSTAWEQDGKTVQLFANYTDEEQTVTLNAGDGKALLLRRTPEISEAFTGNASFALPPRSACAVEF